VQKELEKKGISFHLNAKVTKIGDRTVTFETNGAAQTVPAEIALLATGRRPVTQGFGLEKLGVAVERGAIVTDDRLRTSVAGVWAAGDVNAKWMLAHTAYREAEIALADMLGKREHLRYHTIPSVIYTHPEVGAVGRTADEARAAGFEVVESELPFGYNGRFLAENDNGVGLCKVVLDKKYGTILGIHLLGSYAGEMVHGAGILVENEYRARDLAGIVFPHPTVSEIIKDTILAAGL